MSYIDNNISLTKPITCKTEARIGDWVLYGKEIKEVVAYAYDSIIVDMGDKGWHDAGLNKMVGRDTTYHYAPQRCRIVERGSGNKICRDCKNFCVREDEKDESECIFKETNDIDKKKSKDNT